jgi:hypothetical protein
MKRIIITVISAMFIIAMIPAGSATSNSLPVDWTLTRNGATVNVADFIEGSLTETGGSIRFKQDGEYTLTATITDATGREFATSSSVVVYPIIEIDFNLPDTLHTDSVHKLVADVN